MGGTKYKPFAGISQAMRESSGYKDKAEHALKLIREGANLTFNLKK